VLVLALLQALAAQPDTPEIRRVADGVYAVLQPQWLRFDECNSVVIEAGEGALVVDTFGRPSRMSRLLAEMPKFTAKPVRWVVNTHFHTDHVFGNARLPAGVEFIAHATVREDIDTRARQDLRENLAALPKMIAAAEQQQQAAAAARRKSLLAELQQLQLVLPTVTYDRSLALHHGGREIRLLHFRAHTRGDTVVFLPREKILLTGDLLDDLPYGGHGYPTEWIAALNELEKLDWEQMIPGHGRIRHGKGHLRLVRSMIESAVEQARQAVARGLSADAAKKAVTLEAFRARLTEGDKTAEGVFGEFIAGLIERAVAEAQAPLP
jgi:glyoxylase-like metal-dependent hydrolase (beta-lactamase superfamily II)